MAGDGGKDEKDRLEREIASLRRLGGGSTHASSTPLAKAVRSARATAGGQSRDAAPPPSSVGLLFGVATQLIVLGVTVLALYVVLDRYFRGDWIRWWKLLLLVPLLGGLYCAARLSNNARRIRPFFALTAALTLAALAALSAFTFLFVVGLQPDVVAAWNDPGIGEAIARFAVLFVAAGLFAAWALTAPDRLRLRVFFRGPRLPSDMGEIKAGSTGGRLYANALRLLVTAAIGVVVALWFAVDQLDPFRSHVREYLETPTPGSDGDAYISGKVIPVDPDRQQIDGLLFYKLPWGLRPSKPEEVGTIVRVSCGEDSAGTYESGASAYQTYCDITVIDRDKNLSLAEKRVEGETPPEHKSGYRDWHGGGPPKRKVIAYIKDLPRR